MLRWECIHFRGCLAAAFGSVLTSLRPCPVAALKRLYLLNMQATPYPKGVRNSPLSLVMLFSACVKLTMVQPIKSPKGQYLLIGVGSLPTFCFSSLVNLKLTYIL